jgi:hypothetical protein
MGIGMGGVIPTITIMAISKIAREVGRGRDRMVHRGRRRGMRRGRVRPHSL